MKFKLTLLPLLLILSSSTFGQVAFEQYFEDKTLRIDYHYIGDASTTKINLNEVFSYGTWAGSKSNLIDQFHFGQSQFKIIDLQSNQLIYTQGFDTYFNEYQTTDKAIAGEIKSFEQSALIPRPKSPFQFIIEKRDALNQLHEIFSIIIDPQKEAKILELSDSTIEVFTILENGKPENKIDLVIIGDGYTAEEAGKFESDLKRLTRYFFSVEPFKSHQNKFNIRGVMKPSEDSGINNPRGNEFKNTSLSTSFNALDVDRYLMTENITAVQNIAAYVPHDAILIMANTDKYGGGGIYNYYCTFSADDIDAGFLMLHEFGHSFFGLGDEYYVSESAYNDFYPEGHEPLAANITADTNSASVKWKHLFSENIEIPTPWEKDIYDAQQLNWQKESKILSEEIAALKENKVSEATIKEKKNIYYLKEQAHKSRIQEILTHSKFSNQVGLFEGAGYTSKGLFRPAITCIMFTQEQHFCSVCEEAIIKMMEWYVGE